MKEDISSKIMKENPTAFSRIPFGIFFMVSIFVFVLVFGISVISTSLKPKAYMSAARIEVRYKPDDNNPTRSKRKTYDSIVAKTESEVIQSEAVLRKVIIDLNLNEVYGRKYFDNETLKTWESLAFLKGRTNIRPIPDTTLISINIYDDNPDDAALVANSLAKAYTSYIATNNDELLVQTIDSAYAINTPVRPNMALSYFFGIVTGVFLGLLAGAGAALLVFVKNRKVSEISEG